MTELPRLLDERNLRRLIIAYGDRHWTEEELDSFLSWIGLEAHRIRIPRRPSRTDVCVYVICEDYPDSKLVKVGVSQNAEIRRSNLERQVDRNLYVAYCSIPYRRAVAMCFERLAHEKLSDWALGGEWFSCGRDAAWAAVLESGAVPPTSEDVL